MDDAIRDALSLALRPREEQDRLPMRFSYGPRYGSEDLKDIGFKGPLKQGEHVISEYSADRDVQYPSVYEGITPRDLAAVMMAERLGRAAPPDVDDRAYAAAEHRVQEGRSPFYEPGRDPYPKWSPDQEWEEPAIMRADGGSIEDDRAHEFVQEQLNSGEQQLPQYDPEGGMRTAKRLALDAYGMTDLGGLQEALGYLPKPEGGYEKSALQHAREGDYLTGSMLAMGALVPGAGKVGKALHGAEDALRLAKNDILPKAAQEITSAGTSVNQVPALFSSPHLEVNPNGHRNLDWGGGRFDRGTEQLRERGVESHVYDPYNRPPEHNEKVLSSFKENPADSVTMANVLNVIKEPEARAEAIARTKDYLSPNGKAYFSVYEGDGKGVGAETSKGYQAHRKTKDYLEEIRQHYPDAYVKGKTIIAPHPGHQEAIKLYHSTPETFDPSALRPGSHLGSKEAALDRIEQSKVSLWDEEPGSYRLLDYDYKPSGKIVDVEDTWEDYHPDPHLISQLVSQGLVHPKELGFSLEDYHKLKPYEAAEAFRGKLPEILKNKNISGFKYINKHENIGEPSYIIYDPENLKYLGSHEGESYAEGGHVKYALRLTRQMGGETSDEMIERGEWSPFKGLKYRPAPEKLSSEPDIREYQLKRHAHEFEGAPEPVAPKRKVVVDAPLFGGKKELGELPYDYAGMANTALNALYGLKTAPLYASPYTAPVGRALDAYETAKKIEEDPSAFSSYTAIPKLFKGATPLGLGAMGVGATIAAEDEENKAHGGVVADALRVANKRLKGGKINTKIDRDPDWDMGLRRGGIARK